MKPVLAIGFIITVLVSPALALIIRIGANPVEDNGWPQGSVAVANHPTRFAGSLGPPIGGGLHTLEYRGNEAALQEVVDLFGKIRWPGLQIVVHDEKQNPAAPDAPRVDWTVALWNPQSWYQYSQLLQRLGRGDYREGDPSYPPPTLTVYAPPQGINWDQIKVPQGIEVIDLRALSRSGGVTFRGQLFDMVTSKPVTQAQVRFERRRQPNWDSLATGQVDGAGLVEQKELPPGTYQITVDAQGYVQRVLSMDIPSKGLMRTIMLSPAVTVTGKLLDTEGNPVAGARVQTAEYIGIDGRPYPLSDPAAAVTDDRGTFTFTGLPHGTAGFRVASDGMYLLDVLKTHQIPQSALTLRVTRTGNVKGRVIDAAGNPVTRGNIRISPPGDPVGKWGGSMNIRPDGTFEFKNVPPGPYSITKTIRPMSDEEDPEAKQIEVKAGQTVEVTYTMR